MITWLAWESREMKFRVVGAGWRRLFGALCAGLMAGCGGGGGGAGGGAEGGGNSGDRVTAVFDPPSISVSSIEGVQASTSFTATVNPGGRETLYLALVESRNLVTDGDAQAAGRTVTVSLTMSSKLPAGVYASVVQLLACADPACTQEVAGSPLSLPLRYEVLPQIKIQAPAPMRRAGREAAPVQSLPVTLPAAAGQITVSVRGGTGVFQVTLQGDRLVVQSNQVPSGSYTATVELLGSADSRYRASVDLSYVVEPPVGGEKALSVTPNQFDLRLAQGTQSTYRFKVERPTWTDALDPVTIQRSDFEVVRNLRNLGNGEYEFTVDTSNLPDEAPPNSGRSGYFSNIAIRAGEYGGRAGLPITVSVNAPLSLGNPDLGVLISATTTAANLERSTTVNVADGGAVRWSASSNQPWLQLLRSTGLTGVDELQYRIDASVLSIEGNDLQVAQLSISVDRPGTLPVLANVGANNLLPRFDMASPGVLTSGSAKVYIQGQTRRESEVLTAGVLTVSGATLRRVSIEEDTRFVGWVALLAVELDAIVPGQAVTINAASPLRPAALTLPSVGALRVAAGYAPLPFGRYRPPSFAPGASALVFAGADAAWRWPLGVNGWGALQQQSVSGLIDIAMAPDESDVYAIVPGQVLALDRTTLALRRQGTLSTAERYAFDPSVAPTMSALRFAADGRAFVSLVPYDPSLGGHGVGWLSGCAQANGGVVSDLTKKPCFADPGSEPMRDLTSSPRGTAIASSANGGALAMSYPSGTALLYRGIREQRVYIPSIPAGTAIVSVDNAGTWSVRDDGLLQLIGSAQSFDLRTRVAPGFVPGGYAISGGGEFVVVYSYRIAIEAGAQRARDARLLLFDIRNGLAELVNNPVPAGQVDLLDAVGCTETLAPGETCEHRAAVVVAQGGKSVFVLGPRGVSAVPLPLTMNMTLSEARKRAASFLRSVPAIRQTVR